MAFHNKKMFDSTKSSDVLPDITSSLLKAQPGRKISQALPLTLPLPGCSWSRLVISPATRGAAVRCLAALEDKTKPRRTEAGQSQPGPPHTLPLFAPCLPALRPCAASPRPQCRSPSCSAATAGCSAARAAAAHGSPPAGCAAPAAPPLSQFLYPAIRDLKAKLSIMKADQFRVGPSVEEQRIEERIVELNYREEVMWRQRSRVEWLAAGDCNTRFFHQKVNGRRKKNNISSLSRADGTICSDQMEIGEMVTESYENLYASEDAIGYLMYRIKSPHR
ncbi:uncharacterized protein LOC104584646 [Brachypodium distachyon]|uniref:uncharacterized protein LOC104584646 n=1 Tax=Brachypodium distachyon TaxID=15368 RepID=UPI000D0E01A9|nr:uncharacterized protein LOC104584646 [Brachypodium distachyon]|eukprot:XP_024310390.1 uncharacterized protein LOC104584646 [Brachypodium distachyon]